MIISASRRTDIPAFYSEWLINRLKAGYVYVKNPINPHHLSSVILTPDVVDCIVLCTKNAAPMVNKLDVLDQMGYKYYFQYTITPYDTDIEKRLPPKNQIMANFKRISDKIGKHRMVWRYDPIILSRDLTVRYHIDNFARMCSNIGDYAGKCIFSFVDLYAKVQHNAQGFVYSAISNSDMKTLARALAEIANKHNLPLAACSEAIDLSEFGIEASACIDPKLVEKIIGSPINAKKDPNQRKFCGCMESIDIGAYDSCPHGCIYCYANINQKQVMQNRPYHDKVSPILIGQPDQNDIITERKALSLKCSQLSLF